MGRARDTAIDEPGATNEEATLAAVDARLASLRRGDTPLSCAVETLLDGRDDRRPARAVLEGTARTTGRPLVRNVVAAATAVDLLDARTLARWRGLPGRDPGSTAAVLVGDYLHSLAFEALVATDDRTSAALVGAVTTGVTDLYGSESGVGGDAASERGGVPDAVRRGMFAVADAAVSALSDTAAPGLGR